MAKPLLPPEIDPQDPLPEPSFTWRRLMAFAVVTFVLFWTWRYSRFMPPSDLLPALNALLAFAFGMLLLWAGGASASDIAGVLATLKLRLRGPRPEPVEDTTPPEDEEGR